MTSLGICCRNKLSHRHQRVFQPISGQEMLLPPICRKDAPVTAASAALGPSPRIPQCTAGRGGALGPPCCVAADGAPDGGGCH